MSTNKLNLEAPWEEVKEKMKENDFTLTDEDLDYKPGQEDELLEHLSEKTGKSKPAIKAYIESISANKGKAS